MLPASAPSLRAAVTANSTANIALADGRELLIAPSFEAAREMDGRLAGGVTPEMIKRGLNAQPFSDDNNAARVWQFFQEGFAIEDIMRAALVAALGAK